MSHGSMKGLRVALYARYSSANQREESIDDQFRRLERYVLDAGADPGSIVRFADAAVSGAGLDRPQFQAMLAGVRARHRKIDAVVVEDVSRLSRDQADGLALYREFAFLGVRLICTADGINTTDRASRLTFSIKSMLAQEYLADLSDKTLRGLEGCALAGRATGGRTLGYRTRPAPKGDGKVLNELEVDPEGAAVVKRIFRYRLDGLSLVEIAKRMTDEKVACLREGTKYRYRGWGHTTIRAILMNPRYVGRFEYKKNRWLKEPGTNRRVKRARDASELIVLERPELAIVDVETWESVQRMFAGPQSATKRRTREAYLFSGLLRCGVCGAFMTIAGGSTARYYRCSQQAKRRTCSNAMSVREDVVRACILGELRTRLMSEEGIARARKLVAEALGQLARTRASELREVEQKLEKVESQISNLVAYLANGEHSTSVSAKVGDLEREAKQLTAKKRALKAANSEAIELPTPERVLEDVFDVERAFRTNPSGGRAQLARYFRGGTITLEPQPDGFYVARTQLLPLVALTVGARADKNEATLADESGGPCSIRSCAGWN